MHALASLDSLPASSIVFLILAVGMALGFEFVNGFHDTANAVATVIYTHTLRPWVAVTWSGCWNLIGVATSAGGVAFTILALLPVELVVNVGSGAGFAMVFALLISAIMWNLGTWYLGLPASSSHTLIGSILGVGLANSLLFGSHSFGDGVNWAKVTEVFVSLILSPLVGFIGSALLLLILKAFVKNPSLFKAPPKDAPPPPWIRGLLILTCTGVSYGHGSNDGQKGMGLILLILIGILPGVYALNPGTSPKELLPLEANAVTAQTIIDKHVTTAVSAQDASGELSAYLKYNGQFNDRVYGALSTMNSQIVQTLNGKDSFEGLSVDQRKSLRTDIYIVGATLAKLVKQPVQSQIAPDSPDGKFLVTGVDAKTGSYQKELTGVTQFIPWWVKYAVALALGLGTMIGWKRIVITVGEKIGKEHLTYAQGACAELIAASTIILADRYKMPVSTTHVLSSGVAGTMAANKSGLQMATLRNVLMAWILTLPVCVILGAATFSAGLYAVLHGPVTVLIGLAMLGILAFLVWRFALRGAGIHETPPARGQAGDEDAQPAM
jgi:PiT family inorganic phosphate transporter